MYWEGYQTSETFASFPENYPIFSGFMEEIN